jgi:hypothetical protein
VYVVVTPVCDRAFTTGTAEAQRTGLVPTNISSEYLSFSMSVPWCHDGRHAILPGGEASVGLNTGQVGFENDPLFLLLNGSIGLQIVEDPAATRAVATSQPDGSLVVTGRTVFKATVDVVQIALALLPEFGVEARLQKAFSAMPPRARVALVHQLAGRLLDRLYPRITGVIWVDELPAFAKALEDGIDQILSSAAGMTLNIPVGVETWGPEFQFTLYPGGSATYSFGGPHGTLFDPVVTDFQNNP